MLIHFIVETVRVPGNAIIPAPQTIQVFLEGVDVTTTHYINNIIQNKGLQCRIISIYSN